MRGRDEVDVVCLSKLGKLGAGVWPSDLDVARVVGSYLVSPSSP